jgi:hypothetical protein
MKTKLSIITVLLGLCVNVASAGTGSAGVGYTSDYFRRGALVSEEAVQANASVGFKALGLDSSVGIFTNQAMASGGVDTYIINAGVSGAWGDTVGLSAGLEHAELISGDASLEVVVGLSVDTVLSPTLSVYRDTDDALYTLEVAVSHDVELKIASLGLNASYGNSDVTATSNIDYYSVGASLSRSLSENSTLHGSVAYVDSDSIDSESILGLGLSVKF